MDLSFYMVNSWEGTAYAEVQKRMQEPQSQPYCKSMNNNNKKIRIPNTTNGGFQMAVPFAWMLIRCLLTMCYV